MVFDCAIVGLFEGVAFNSAAKEEPSQVKWLLRILPQNDATRPYNLSSSAIPTLYGVSLGEDGEPCGFLRGQHEADGTLAIYENPLKDGDNITKHSVSSLSVEGTAAKLSCRDEKNVAFVMQCDTDLSSTPLEVNLYVGAAVPHPDIAAFMIPTNPIEWLVLERRAASSKKKVPAQFVAAAGYFVSGDIQGQPAMLYTVEQQRPSSEGEKEAAPRCSDLKFKKVYEPAQETEGYDVDYAAQMVELNGRKAFVGKWNNSKGGTHGYFACAAQPLDMQQAPVAMKCEDLRAPFPIGSIMLKWEDGAVYSFDAMHEGQDGAIVQVCHEAEKAKEKGPEGEGEEVPKLMLPFTMRSLCFQEASAAPAAEASSKY